MAIAALVSALLVVVYHVSNSLPGHAVESDVGAPTESSNAVHGSTASPADNGLLSEVRASSFEETCVAFAVVFILALLAATYWTKLRLPKTVADELNDLDVGGKSWSRLSEGVVGVAEACLVAALVLIFSIIVEQIIDRTQSTPLGWFALWLAVTFLVAFAGKPYVVFGIGTALFGLVESNDFSPLHQFQILAVAAAFASQFSPASLSTDYLYDGKIETWIDTVSHVGMGVVLRQTVFAAIAIGIAILQ